MLKCSCSVGKKIAFVINMETYSLVIAADPQTVLRQGVVRVLLIMNIKAFFIVNGMLFRLLIRLFRRRSSAFARLSFAFIS